MIFAICLKEIEFWWHGIVFMKYQAHLKHIAMNLVPLNLN